MDETKQNGGYETTDARLSIPVVGGIVLLVLTVVVVGLMAAMFGLLEKREAAREPAPSPMAAFRTPPQGPRLQTDPPQALQTMRSSEEGLLSAYAWVNRENGIVRIPIDRAMALVAERGLPVRDTTGGKGR